MWTRLLVLLFHLWPLSSRCLCLHRHFDSRTMQESCGTCKPAPPLTTAFDLRPFSKLSRDGGGGVGVPAAEGRREVSLHLRHSQLPLQRREMGIKNRRRENNSHLLFQAALHGEFSRHGLVYEVSLPLSPANQEPIDHDVAEPAVAVEQQSPASETEYGFVTFYSRLDAKNALQNIQKNPISINNHSLKVSHILLCTLS